MNNILETRKHEYQVLDKINKDRKQDIENKLNQIKNQFSIVRDGMKTQETLYEEKVQNATPKYLKELDNAREYNKHLYSIEIKKYLSIIDQLENQRKTNDMHLVRCNIYIEYLEAVEKKDAILINSKFYQLLNAIQKELLHKLVSGLEHYNSKMDINNNYILFIKLCIENKQGDVEMLSKHVLDQVETIETNNMIKDYSNDIEEYKNLFKNNKFEMTDEIMQSNTFMLFDIKEVIDKIYKIEKVKK